MMLCVQKIIVCFVVCHMAAICTADSTGCKDKWDDYCLREISIDPKRCDDSYYQPHCLRTCGLCGAPCGRFYRATQFNMDLYPNDCKLGENKCVDMRSGCSLHKCSDNRWKVRCRKTCSACVHGVTTSTTTTSTICEDSRDDCSTYGDCGNPAWISVCRRTCNACGDEDASPGVKTQTTASTTSTTPETWGAWGSWTCSVTCGRGRESRTRTCTPGARCAGDASQTQECQRPECCVPRHAQWSTWGSWSSCSPSCGQRTQTRSRTCYEPNACGQPCEGNFSESQDCIVKECSSAPRVPSITTDPPTSPFSVGVTVTLTCSSLDLGSPPATLTWVTRRQGVRTTPVNERTTRLEMFNLSVEDDGLSVKCLASNSVSHKETSFVLRVDQKATFGECHASASSSTWEVTGYCDIIKVFSSNNQYHCTWREIKDYNTNKFTGSFNQSLITPGGKLLRGRCGFQTKIPQDFPEWRELSEGLKYQMYFNPGGTWSPIFNVFVASPKAPTLTCPADVTEGSHMNCTCSTSDVGEPGGRLLLFFDDRLEDTGQYGQKVIILSRDVRREDNNVRVSCRLHWARNMSADRDWTLSVLYPPAMPSLIIDSQTTVNYTTNVNKSVSFTCRVGPSNVHSLELLKVTRNGSQIVQGLSTSYPHFRMQKAGCGDSGTYYCRAGNTLAQTNSSSVQLNVKCSPGLVNGTSARTKQLKVTEGSQGQLTFEVTGYPVPNIVVVSYHQGKNMSKEEPVRADLFTGKCEQNTPDVHLATCTLSIADATYTDNGMYNVHLSNSQGTIHVPVELIVDTQDSSDNASSLSWIGIVITLLIIIVIGVLIVFFVRRRRAAQTKTSENKKKISSTATARRNLEDPVYYNVTVADVTMPSSAATMTSGTFNLRNGSVALTSPNENVYFNYEKKTSLNDRGESSAGTTSDDSPEDNLYALVDKTQKSSSSENTGKPPKPAPMPKPKRSGSASRKSAENGGTGQSQNDSLVQESGDLLHPSNEAAGPDTTHNTTDNEEGLFYTELDFSQHRPQSKRPLPQKEETNYAAIDFKLQK